MTTTENSLPRVLVRLEPMHGDMCLALRNAGAAGWREREWEMVAEVARALRACT